MITCQNLIVGYTTPVSPQFSLEIKDNEWVGIIGQNGAGKSTFLKTVLGNLAPYAGILRVLNESPGKFNRYISYIPQEREINLPDKMSGFSLIKNSYVGWRYGIPCFNTQLEQRMDSLIDLVGANGYAHKPFNLLSGGQKKRIYLAQALINKPRILLLDEPLADLDPHAKQHFIQSLQKIREQEELGLLIISHDMHEIATHLDAFIHFRPDGVHYCETLACVKEDSYVGI